MQIPTKLPVILLCVVIGSFRVTAGVIATLTDEFSGVQGQNGWIYGYREAQPGGTGESFDPERDFRVFAGGEGKGDWNGVTQQWTGTSWKTSAGSEITGRFARLGSSDWLIRRWKASELTEKSAVALRWSLAKDESTCGNGVTGALYINGKLADRKTIASDQVSAVTRTFYALLCPDDYVDLVIRSVGTDGTDDIGCDRAQMTWVISTSINPSPRQPDGKLFITTLKASELSLRPPRLSAAEGQVTLTWGAQASATYAIETSGDMLNWTRIKSGLVGSACQSSLTEMLPRPEPAERFYRVVEESKTIEGLWTVFLDGVTWNLIQIRLEGDDVIATKVIGDDYVPSGKITWTASLSSGIGQIQSARSGFRDPSWHPAELAVINSDQLALTVFSLAEPLEFRRVD